MIMCKVYLNYDISYTFSCCILKNDIAKFSPTNSKNCHLHIHYKLHVEKFITKFC